MQPFSVDHTYSYGEALRGLTSVVFLRDDTYRRQQWRANRNGAHPDILDFERLFVRRMRKLDVPVFAHNMVRTRDEQDALYARGVSKAKGLEGPHVHGCAVDIVHSLHAWDIPEKGWELFGHVGKEIAAAAGIPIEWGGDWVGKGEHPDTDLGWDPAHWELKPWRKFAPYAKDE